MKVMSGQTREQPSNRPAKGRIAIVRTNGQAHLDLDDVLAAAMAKLKESGAVGMPITPSLHNFEGEPKPNFRIPYFDLDRKPIGYSRLRYLFALFPSKFGEEPSEEDKKHKYHQEKGSTNHAYFPPCVNWRKLRANPNGTVLWTEGEIKAWVASKLGFPCIGLGGSYGWKVKDKDTLLPELEAFARKGWTITLVCDSDVATNQRARQGFDRACAILKAKGALVRLLILPALGDGKTGLDDFLVAKGKAALAELVTSTAPWRPGIIMVNDLLPVAIDMAETVLALDPKLYQRGTELARLVEQKPAPKAVITMRRPESNTYFATAGQLCLREDLARAHCVFRSKATKKKEKTNETNE
jgi:hypothetical protein